MTPGPPETDPPNWPAPTSPPVASPPPPAPPSAWTPAAAPPASTAGSNPSNAPPPPPAGADRGRVRPWWGMGDVLLAVPLTIVVLLVGFVVLAVLASIEGISLDDLADDAPLPGSMLVIPTLIQQAAWFGWPFVVSRWKGLGPAADWGWAFKPADIGIGFGTALIGLFAAGAVGTGTAALVDLEDDEAAENTALLTDLEGSPWLWGVIFMVVIGAPFAEEVLFRGLVLRAVAKRWGVVAGVIGSLLTFVPIHFADGGVFVDGRFAITDGQIVLWATIAALGLVLAVVTVRTERLAAAIVAHILINGVGVIGALEVFGELG
ncbi:MAG: CPBP family intramembrane glutamic endopeptidase [Actinomycetota bacterium]